MYTNCVMVDLQLHTKMSFSSLSEDLHTREKSQQNSRLTLTATSTEPSFLSLACRRLAKSYATKYPLLQLYLQHVLYMCVACSCRHQASYRVLCNQITTTYRLPDQKDIITHLSGKPQYKLLYI